MLSRKPHCMFRAKSGDASVNEIWLGALYFGPFFAPIHTRIAPPTRGACAVRKQLCGSACIPYFDMVGEQQLGIEKVPIATSGVTAFPHLCTCPSRKLREEKRLPTEAISCVDERLNVRASCENNIWKEESVGNF